VTGPAPARAQAGPWHAFAASVTGAAHIAQDRPNEDAFLAHRRGAVSVATVADGHGSSRCPRAGRGAALAVAVIADLLEEVMADGGDAERVRRRLVDDAGPALVERWRAEVAADADRRPFSPEELGLIGADPPGLSDRALWLAYGCTLVAVAANADVLIVFQIGDGDCILVSRDQVVSRPLPEDPTNRGNVTSSLSQAEPLESLRCAAVDLGRQPQLLALVASDGFGGAYAEADWWHQVGRDLAHRSERLTPEELGARLPDWLAEPARVGGDDATMALLVADGGAGLVPAPPADTVVDDTEDVVTAPVPAHAEPVTSELTPSAPEHPHDDAPKRGRLPLAVAGLLLIVLVTGATVWLVTASSYGNDPEPAPTTLPASATTTGSVVKEPPGPGSDTSSATASYDGSAPREANDGAGLLDEDPDG
jgi:hypothetical protein